MGRNFLEKRRENKGERQKIKKIVVGIIVVNAAIVMIVAQALDVDAVLVTVKLNYTIGVKR